MYVIGNGQPPLFYTKHTAVTLRDLKIRKVEMAGWS